MFNCEKYFGNMSYALISKVLLQKCEEQCKSCLFKNKGCDKICLERIHKWLRTECDISLIEK